MLNLRFTISLTQGESTTMTFTSRVHKLIVPFTLAGACMTAPAQAEDYASWGVGYGISYAYLGANIDYRLAPNVYVTGAVGTGIKEFSLAAGARYYLLPSLFETARARVSVMYGPYGSVTHTPPGQSKRSENFSGVAVGMGMLLFNDNEGFDFDIYYINTRPAKSSLDRYNAALEPVSREGLDPLSVAIGYRRRF